MPSVDREKQSIIDRIGAALLKKGVPVEPLSAPTFVPNETTQISRSYLEDWAEAFGVSRVRVDMYNEYEMMEADSPIIESALNAVADTAVSGAQGEAEESYNVQFETEEGSVKRLFEDLEARLSLKEGVWARVRSTSKLGDLFAEIVVDPRLMEIVALKPLPAKSMMVVPDEITGYLNDDVAYKQEDLSGKVIAEFKDWQICHFANKVDLLDLYGRSMLYSCRRTYRQLQMVEDAMVINRLTRAVMRYVHKIPTGNMSPEAAELHIEQLKKRRRQIRRFDPKTGKLLINNNPLVEETDFYVPVGANAQGDVTAIQGQQGLDRIADVEHFVKKLFAGLRVPPAYVGWERDTAGKSVIVTIDIAFARLVRRAQLTEGIGLRQIYDTQAALSGIDPRKLKYNLLFAPISTVDEMRRWQLELLKVQVAKMLKIDAQLVQDDEFLLRSVMEYEDEDVKALLKAKEDYEAKQDELAAHVAKSTGQPAPPSGTRPDLVASIAPKLPPADRNIESYRGSARVSPPRSVQRAVEKLMRSNGELRRTLNEVANFALPFEVTSDRGTFHVNAESIRRDFVGR